MKSCTFINWPKIGKNKKEPQHLNIHMHLMCISFIGNNRNIIECQYFNVDSMFCFTKNDDQKMKKDDQILAMMRYLNHDENVMKTKWLRNTCVPSYV